MAWRAVVALGAVLIALSAVAPARAQSVGPGTWTTKAPMPEGVRGEVAAVVFENKLYAIGGNVASNAVPRNEVYDPATDRWRSLAPMPVARDHLGLALVNGKIYTFGGFVKTVHEGAGTDVFEYDPATNTWRARAPLKSPLGSVGAAVIGNKIHVFGGRGLDKVTTTTHSVYDPATDKWTDAAPLSKARDHMAVVAAEGKIHVIGGRFTSPVDRTDMHEIYDPATDSWSTAAPLKTPRSAVAAALYRGMIVVDGGEWPPEKPHLHRERRLRSQDRQLGVARRHAARQPWLRRRRDRAEPVFRRRLDQARRRRPDRPLADVHAAVGCCAAGEGAFPRAGAPITRASAARSGSGSRWRRACRRCG